MQKESKYRGQDLSGVDFQGQDLSGADFRGCRLVGANFAGAILHGANLEGAELLDCNLQDADLSSVHAPQAGFNRANLQNAQCFDANFAGARFIEADIRQADLCRSCLDKADLRKADVRYATFQKASLIGADLSGSQVAHAHFDDANLQASHMALLIGFQQAHWLGVNLKGMDSNGAYLLQRHIADENYLHEFRNQSATHEWIYRLWWVTSDCGRSFLRWGLWTGLLVASFAGIYSLLEVDYGNYPTLISPLYYSVVTLTSLGYGDVLPASEGAQIAAMIEVVTGYVMLGGLLSIFATKMARRA